MFGGSSDNATKELPAPLDTPYSEEELKQYDGSDETKPVFVAIRGDIFDVSSKRASYSPGAGYNVFAGKDASYALAASSLAIEDCHSNIDNLTEEEKECLQKWYLFFSKNYPIVGKVKK